MHAHIWSYFCHWPLVQAVQPAHSQDGLECPPAPPWWGAEAGWTWGAALGHVQHLSTFGTSPPCVGHKFDMLSEMFTGSRVRWGLGVGVRLKGWRWRVHTTDRCGIIQLFVVIMFSWMGWEKVRIGGRDLKMKNNNHNCALVWLKAVPAKWTAIKHTSSAVTGPIATWTERKNV